MEVENMISKSGNAVANQFLITEEGRGVLGNFIKRETFQSYGSTIAIITTWEDSVEVKLDKDYWDYSKTTGVYRNQFLNEGIADTRLKIKSGEYKLANLN